MIHIENISNNVVKIKVPEKIKDGDFQEITRIIDKLIKENKTIKLLVDATKFHGWENIAAFKQHLNFVKHRHKKVDRIGVIAGYTWQHWVVSVVRMFVHPKIKVFNSGQKTDAEKWVKGE